MSTTFLGVPSPGRITAPWGAPPATPTSPNRHLGTDRGWGNGDIVYAMRDGFVTGRAYVGAYGNRIVLSHGAVSIFGLWETWYCHLSEFFVAHGAWVKRGDPIGRQGATGNVTGKHLHSELRINGVSQDEVPWQSRIDGGAAPAGDNGTPITEPPAKSPDEIWEDEFMGARDDVEDLFDTFEKKLDQKFEDVRQAVIRERWKLVYDAGWNADEGGKLAFDDAQVTRAALLLPGGVQRLPEAVAPRMAFIEGLTAGRAVFTTALEAARPAALTSVEFGLHLDMYALGADTGFGTFVENRFELEGGDTLQVRTDGEWAYRNRRQVHRDGRPVRITKGGVTVVEFSRIDGVPYASLENGVGVVLTETEVQRADAQRAGGQPWLTA